MGNEESYEVDSGKKNQASTTTSKKPHETGKPGGLFDKSTKQQKPKMWVIPVRKGGGGRGFKDSVAIIEYLA